MTEVVQKAIYAMGVTGADQLDRAAASLDRVAVAEEKVTRATRTSEDGLNRLIARLDPRVKAEQQLARAQEAVGRYRAEGIGSEQQHAQVIDLATRRYNDQVAALGKAKTANDNFAASGTLARHEVINLSRQIQDVGVSLASGQSPFTVLVQQGTQVADIFASSQGSVKGFFDQTLGFLGRVVTPARAAIAGIAGIGVAAVTAALQWSAAQREISQALAGTGRASGATVSSINTISAGGASAFGLSVSEAREIATALAATGRVGVDAIGPIVALGKDIARIYGEDATKAAERLAAAFADPAKGADDLNRRLGFLDAGMQKQIRNLADQNRLYEAQRTLIDGVKTGLDGVGRNVAGSAQFWTAIGNAISNVWDATGQIASRVTGIGFVQGLTDQIEESKRRIAELEAIASRRTQAVNRSLGTTSAIERERTELAKLTVEWEKNQKAVFDAQMRRDSFQNAAAVRTAVPEADARDQISNTVDIIRRIENESAFDEEGLLLKRLGITREQLSLAKQRTQEALDSFKSQIERTIANSQITLDAINARTPAQRADIARRSSLLNGSGSAGEKAAVADLEYQRSIRQEMRQIKDAEEGRTLTAKQRVEQSYLELGLVGKSVAEQERARAALQAKQQLEQDALRIYGDREAYDRKHLQSLTDQLTKEAAIRQTIAEQQLSRDTAFERAQLGRSDGEQFIASRLRGVYGEDYVNQLDGAAAQQLRLNEYLRVGKELSLDFATGFARELRSGVGAAEALGNALDRLTDRLLDLALNKAISTAFGGLTGMLSSPAGPTGVVGTNGSLPVPTFNARGNAFHGGNVIPFARGGVVDRPTLFPMANGAGLMGEAGPEAVMPLRRAADGKLGVSGGSPVVNVNVLNQSGGKSNVEVSQPRKNSSGGIDLDVIVRQVDSSLAKGIADGSNATGKAIQGAYGARRVGQ